MHILKGHNGVVYGVAFHPRNDRFIATASGDGTVKLWDVAKGRNLITFTPFDGYDYISVKFMPDGRRLVVTGEHESVAVIDLSYFNRHIIGNLALQIEMAIEAGVGETISDQVEKWESALRDGRSPLD